jgi:hypothetical protein
MITQISLPLLTDPSALLYMYAASSTGVDSVESAQYGTGLITNKKQIFICIPIYADLSTK